MKPFLSLCISTYNRAPFLRCLINDLFQMDVDFPFEIVVTDNCSTDDTQEVARKYQHLENFRYFRQSVKIEADGNNAAALRVAKGKYCIWMADDDFLRVDGLLKALNFLEKEEKVVCVLAPWELWDDVKKEVTSEFYKVEKEIIFGKKNYKDFFDYIINNQVYPEIAVFRTAGLMKYAYNPHKTFISYPLMTRLLGSGAIAFLPTPFYRLTIISEIDDNRIKAGIRATLEDWDKYRGGLEWLLDKALPVATTTPEKRDLGLKMINGYLMIRVSVAIRLLTLRKRYMEACECVVRIRAMGANDPALIRDTYNYLRPRAGLQAVGTMAKETPSIKHIIYSDTVDTAAIEKIVVEIDMQSLFRKVNAIELEAVENKNEVFLIVGNSSDLSKFENLGFCREKIMTEEEILSIY